MTAVPPRPAAFQASAVHRCPFGQECPPPPGAPEVSTDTGALREALAKFLFVHSDDTQPDLLADALLALPALRDLIAERDQAVAAVERVRELCTSQGDDSYVMAYALRRAIKGTP